MMSLFDFAANVENKIRSIGRALCGARWSDVDRVSLQGYNLCAGLPTSDKEAIVSTCFIEQSWVPNCMSDSLTELFPEIFS